MAADAIDLNLGRHAVELARREWGEQPLKPIGSRLAELVNMERKQSNDIGEWYVASYDGREQDHLVKAIADQGPIPYIALIPKRERHGRGAERTVYRSMFGLYMFIKCTMTDEHFQMITSTRGIRRLLGRDGKPKPIEGGKMDAIRHIVALEEEKEADREIKEVAAKKAQAGGKSGIVWDFSPEERVKIKSGPFTNFYAELKAAVDSNDRVRAQIALFGGPRVVEISAFDIEKAT